MTKDEGGTYAGNSVDAVAGNSSVQGGINMITKSYFDSYKIIKLYNYKNIKIVIDLCLRIAYNHN
jgi:hypothetical protein